MTESMTDSRPVYEQIKHEQLRHIAQYEIVDAIGLGGMSSVFRAIEDGTGRSVALKLMHHNLALNPEFRRRFVEMGQAIAALDHPHIVRVYEAVADGDLLYMVMEYYRSTSLRARLNEYYQLGQFADLREVVSICRQVAQALHHAHGRGIIHRDVKPDNVLVKPSEATLAGVRAILTDFGLAQRINVGETLTGGIEILGTPAYMSPEQARGLPHDGRSDVYSLGIMLYELITGQQPFPAASVNEMILMQTQGEPLKVQELRPSVPPALVSIILRAIRKNPDERYETAAEIGRELEALEKSIRQLEAETIRVFPPIAPRRPPEKVTGPATLFDVMPVLDRPVLPVDLISAGTDDMIVLTPPESSPRTVALDRSTLSVGRDAKNDLVLDDPLISRRHLSIERLPDGRLAVTDVGSQNGSYFDDLRLAKNTTTVWGDGQSVKIGATWMTLRLARAPIGVGRRQLALVASTPAAVKLGPSSRALITPVQTVIEPGRAVLLRVEVENQAAITQGYRLDLRGLSADWYTIAPLPLSVPPKARGDRLVTLHPPRLPSTTPGAYSFVLTVTVNDDDGSSASVDCMLVVYAYNEYTTDASVGGRGIRVQVANQGNESRFYVVEVREPSNMLIIAPARTRLSVPAGVINEVTLRIQPKRRPLIGNATPYPVEVFIRSDGLMPHSHSVAYEVLPRLAWWVLVIVGVFVFSVLLYVLTNAL
jgi:serine/threonine protein kinase